MFTLGVGIFIAPLSNRSSVCQQYSLTRLGNVCKLLVLYEKARSILPYYCFSFNDLF